MSEPLVIGQELTQLYGEVRALNGVSFEINRGETLAVVGESGCGKSTLARILTMIEPPHGGRLQIGGDEISPESKRPGPTLRRKVQIVFQNPYGSLNPRKTIASTLEEPLLLNTKQNRSERRERVLMMLDKVGMRPEHADRYPHMFSGGQRQRVAVARALMLEPEILVLDEPVSALDLSIQAQVLNMLADLQEEFNLTYVFISHDLSVVRHIADNIMVMYFGRAVEMGESETVFASPRHPYTHALFSATPQADPEREDERVRLKGEPPSPMKPPPGCPFAPRCVRRQDRCDEQRPSLEPHAGALAACYYPLTEAA
ncbi:MAG: dipeptide ABC transporter ATP-binding protein [Pseudomonadota bacterium]